MSTFLPTASLKRPAAFSLLELLVVVAIIAVLTVLAIPAVNTIGRAGEISKVGADIAGTLELARAHAMANNTHVWVGFVNEPADDTVVLGVVASRNGDSQPDASALTQISRLQRFRGVQLTVPPESDARPVVTAGGNLAESTSALMEFSAGGGAGEIVFDTHVIHFNSRGEARIHEDTLHRIIEIGLQGSANGVIRNPENYAAVQVGGLSGSVSLHRP